MLKYQLIVLLLVALARPLAAADKDVSKNDSTKQVADRKVGVLDVNHLLKKHAALKRKLFDLGVEARLVQAKYESELKALLKKSEELKDLTSESREYRKLNEETVKDKARIEAEIALARKDFERREAQLYLEVYQEIKKDVEKIAKSQHLALVLNVNLGEINGDNPQDVARGITDKVVWFDDSVDLTPQLERNYAHCPAPAAADKGPSLVGEPSERESQSAPRTATAAAAAGNSR